jgi:hypothetical protein
VVARGTKSKVPQVRNYTVQARKECYSLESDEKVISYAAIASGLYAALEE